jgi:transcriptional regulator GlxA family with amidase domain
MASLILEINNLIHTEFGFELSCLSIITRLWKDVLVHISDNEPDFLQNKVNIKNESRMRKILSYIHENYAENITINNIANHANISRRECFRCFKHFTNKNPVEYINEYRLACASRLLIESALSITEVGMACGFNNSSYFGKLFRDKYGMSPRQYRYKK